MKKLNLYIGSVLLLGAAAACLFLSRLAVPGAEIPLWKNYHPLLVVNTVPERVVADYFSERGIPVESLSDARVFLHNYPGVSLHSFSGIMTSLPREDPRQDPVFDRITSFYTHFSDGRYWNIYYLKTDDLSRVHALASESGIPAGETWFLPEYTAPAGEEEKIRFLLFLLCLLGAALFSGSFIPAAAALVLVPASGFMPMLPADYLPLAGVLSLFSLVFLLKGTYRISALVCGSGLVFTVFSRTDHPFLLASVFLLYLSLLYLLPGSWESFISTKITAGFRGLKRIIQIIFYLLAGGLASSFFFAPIEDMPRVSYPVPVIDSAHGFTLNNLDNLYEKSANDTFINASDLLVHFAYQQGFMYNAPYKVPSSAEPLVLPRYKVESGKISSWNEIILEYDQVWLNESLAVIGKYSPGSVILSQENPVRFELITKTGRNRQLSARQLMDRVTAVYLSAVKGN